jgi:hypothetical protein
MSNNSKQFETTVAGPAMIFEGFKTQIKGSIVTTQKNHHCLKESADLDAFAMHAVSQNQRK